MKSFSQHLATFALSLACLAPSVLAQTEAASSAAQQGGSVVHRLVATLETVRRSATRLDEIGEAIEIACNSNWIRP